MGHMNNHRTFLRLLLATPLAAVILAVTLLAATPAHAARPNPNRTPVHFGGSCRVVASDADHDTGKLDRIAARHGGVDYTGAKYGPGVWTLNDTGKVFGWSAEEDSIIYSTLQCAKIRPAYVA